MEDKPNCVVIFQGLYKSDAEKIVQLSKQFSPAFQIENHFTCDECQTETYSVEYLEKCPGCGAFLWTNAEHQNC